MKTSSLACLNADKPPEWRWFKALALRQQKKRTRTVERDAHIQAAMDFLDAMDKCRDDFDWEELFEDHPDAMAAFTFWVDPVLYKSMGPARPSITESRRQAALEAYLLSGIDRDRVALKMGVTPLAVELYELWFYDFRSRVDLLCWMSTHGYRGDLSGQSGASFDHLLRLYGLNYGEESVDDLLRGTNYSEKTKKAMRQELPDHLTKGSAIAVRGMLNPVSLLEATRGTIEIEDRRHQFEVEAGTEFRNQAENAYYTKVEDEFGGMNWTMVEVPPAVEKALPALEKRMAVQLGYDKDLSIHVPNEPASD